MPGDARSDEQLLRACRRGDDAAFEALYYRHRDWVVRVALRYCGDRDAALDVLQETFAYLLRKLPNLELHAKLTTFLYPVIKHSAQAARRKTARLNATDTVPDQPAPSTEHDPRATLAELVATLPEEQREVLMLRFADGLTLEEMAAALNVPVGTVKSRLHRAISALRHDPLNHPHSPR